MTEGIHTGGCICGAVRYRVAGERVRVSVCHCTYCQKSSGAPYIALAVFPEEAVSVTGDVASYTHVSDVSGAAVRPHHCPVCATRLYFHLDRYPGVIGVIAGTFDDPNCVPRDDAKARHIFTRSAVRGTVLPAGVRIYEAHAMDAEGGPLEPIILSAPFTVKDTGGFGRADVQQAKGGTE